LDRQLAIQELCSRYCQTIDAQDAEGWARCFVPDGAFEFDGHIVRGEQALRVFAEAHAASLSERHMTLNHLYEVDGERATGRATTVVSIATPRGYRIMGQGIYQDDLVKVSGNWKIRHRRFEKDYLVTDPTKPVNLSDPEVAPPVRKLIESAEDLAKRAQQME
jgi:uncharacterized protein (TIGR02246 family)